MNLGHRTRMLLVITPLCLAFTLVTCSSGPPAPAQGSPEWYWENAGTTWETGDLLKTSDNLEAAAKADSPLAAQAQPWRLIITSGLAAGYMEIADALERGERANQAAATAFRRQMNNYRSLTNRQVAQFYQTFMEFKKTGAADAIPLAFSPPKGSVAAVAELTRAGEGVAVSEAEMSRAERRILQRAVLMAASRSVGAAQDTAKARQILGAANATVPKDTFMLSMANTFHDMADYYNPYKIDQPDRFQMFNEQALEIVKELPESDDTKELIEQIEDELKAAKRE